MKVAILSDVHANLDALHAVSKYLDRQKPDQVIFLGDAVGYGPEPNECLELLREMSQMILMGNHDAAAVGLTDTARFNIWAREAVEFTSGILLEENRSYLTSLPYIEQQGDLYLVHASPHEPHQWHYVFTVGDAMANFDHFDGSVCFLGHSHQPLVIGMHAEGKIHVGKFTYMELEENTRYIVNVGSVGQPRDGDPRAAVVIYDDLARAVVLDRIEYDIGAVQEKMRQKKLPPYLADRLSEGL